MPEATAAAPAAPDSRTIAENLTRGIQDKANGKAPAAAPGNEQQPSVNPSAKVEDVNAGKEKYVVEGREVWLTPAERTAWIQKGMAFQPRMDELARLRQETIQFNRALLSDPGKVLSNIAQQQKIPLADIVQRVLHGTASQEVKEAIGKWYWEEAVIPSKMSPEQLKAREDARWRAERENQDKSNQEAAIRAENNRRFVAALGQLRAQVNEAMKESGLPAIDTPFGAEMAKMVAQTMQLADRRRIAMTPKQAIELVKQHRIRSVQATYYEALADKEDNGETLVKELGEKVAKRVQAYFLKQAQGKGAGQQPPIVPKGQPRTRNGERETITPDDMHEYLEEIKRRG